MKTKKALVLFAFATLLVFLMIGSVMAQTVNVTCQPEEIYPGESTSITVSCDKGGIGYIKVIQPDGKSSMVGIRIPSGGGSIEKVYPDEFPDFPHPASTEQLGEYRVRVALLGLIWVRVFRVTFFVIPELPLGALMATTTSLTALTGIVIAKHFRRKHRLR